MILAIIVTLIASVTLTQAQYNEHHIFMSFAAWLTAFLPIIALVRFRSKWAFCDLLMAFSGSLIYAFFFHIFVFTQARIDGREMWLDAPAFMMVSELHDELGVVFAALVIAFSVSLVWSASKH